MTALLSVIQLNQQELDALVQESQLARKAIANIDFYLQNQERKNQLWLEEKQHLQAENERITLNAGKNCPTRVSTYSCDYVKIARSDVSRVF